MQDTPRHRRRWRHVNKLSPAEFDAELRRALQRAGPQPRPPVEPTVEGALPIIRLRRS